MLTPRIPFTPDGQEFVTPVGDLNLRSGCTPAHLSHETVGNLSNPLGFELKVRVASPKLKFPETHPNRSDKPLIQNSGLSISEFGWRLGLHHALVI